MQPPTLSSAICSLIDDQNVNPHQGTFDQISLGQTKITLVSGSDLLCCVPDFEFFFAISDLSDSLHNYIKQVHRLGCLNDQGCLMLVLDIPEAEKSNVQILHNPDVDISSGHAFDEQGMCSLSANYSWLPLRSSLGQISDQLFHFLGAGLQLVTWYTMHQYCGACGGKTRLHHKDRAMHCLACNAVYFPRISPCVIGVVKKGQQILLAHNVNYRHKRFSALAGFIEPGESAEDAFRREVMEEVGIEIKNLRYVQSQPWPFPGQLMLGFFAEHAAGDIVVDEVEIDEAHWFDITDLPSLPPQGTISRDLIDQVVQELSG